MAVLTLHRKLLMKVGIPYEMPQENIPSGFEPTQDASRASKMLINGQLVIIKNGVRFNAVGAKL